MQRQVSADALLTFVCLALMPSVTHAADGVSDDPSERVTQDVRIGAQLGGFGGVLDPGVASGLVATYRWSFLEAGALFEGFFGGTYGLIAAVGGPTWATDAGFQVSAHGMLGRNGFAHIGCDDFCTSPSFGGTLPYVGPA